MNYIKQTPKAFFSKKVVLACLCVLAILLSACGSTPSQQGSGTTNNRVKAVDVPDAAKSDYKSALAAIDKKDWGRAEGLLQNMQTSYPKLLSTKATLGWVYWQSGKTEKAIAELQAAIDTKKLYRSDAYNYLAIIYRSEGKFAQSEKLYKQAIQIWPGDAVLHKNLGILYELYLGRLSDALKSYKQSQAINGKDKRLNGWVKDLERRTS